MALYAIIKSITEYNPQQTVTDLSYHEFGKDEYPCIAITFWDKQKQQFAEEIPEGIGFTDLNSGTDV